jgi:hypothetical protein
LDALAERLVGARRELEHALDGRLFRQRVGGIDQRLARKIFDAGELNDFLGGNSEHCENRKIAEPRNLSERGRLGTGL